MHQKRVHGRIDVTRIDDKYSQLYDTVYELYESLLGIRLIVQPTTVDRQQRQSTIVEQQPKRQQLEQPIVEPRQRRSRSSVKRQQQPMDDEVDEEEEDDDDDESKVKRGAAPNIITCRLCDRPFNGKVCTIF